MIIFYMVLTIFHPEVESWERVYMQGIEAPSMGQCQEVVDNMILEQDKVSIDGHIFRLSYECVQEM